MDECPLWPTALRMVKAAHTAGLYEPTLKAGELFANKGTSDSPHGDLAAHAKTLSVNDQFTYYIMFKPVTAKDDDAIWVPVAKGMVVEGHSDLTTGQYLEDRSTQAENRTKRHDGSHRFPDT
jgi:hypothetical protein